MEQAGIETRKAEIVRWAYRLILGRDPESDAVVETWSPLSPREIASIFVGSAEGAVRRAEGYPTFGGWQHEPISRDAVVAGHRLLRGGMPSEGEVAAALRLHASLRSLRATFLERLEAGGTLAEAEPEPQEERGFAFLGQGFTLRGTTGEAYWRSLADGAPDPGAERLARVALAAFPDGGAGRVLVDAGANLGLSSLALAAAAPYHAALLAIEPDARTAALLRHNLAANGLTEARAVEAALGAEDGMGTMQRASHNSATSFILGAESRVPAADETLEVPVRSLDTVLAEQGLGRLDLLKIDVEGGETDVMLGAARAIRRDRPMVFAEFNLWTQMTVAGRNPMEVLEEWHAAFPHFIAFGDDGRPLAIHGTEGMLWLLYAVMTRRGGVDDVVLCHDLGWLERWA